MLIKNKPCRIAWLGSNYTTVDSIVNTLTIIIYTIYQLNLMDTVSIEIILEH